MAGNNGKNSAAIRLLVLAIGAALIAACGNSGDQAGKPAAAPATTEAAKSTEATPAAAAPQAAPAAPAIKSLSVTELLKRAATSLAEGRLVDPPENNAAEYYLTVLDKDSGNLAARDGLREMFPLATGVIEQQINAGQVDQSLRSINLLGKADPNNYTLTILRNKLDLKKKQMEHDQDKKDQDKKDQDSKLLAARNAAVTAAGATTGAAVATATPAGAVPTAPGTPVNTPASTPAAPATASTTTAAKPSPAPAAAATAPAATAVPPAGSETHGATLVKRVPPNYPPEAARKREEGWVEVAFTVDADGKVKDVSVVNANPARIFNEAAIRAVQNWTFQPRLENGKAVEQQIKSRIEFKL